MVGRWNTRVDCNVQKRLANIVLGRARVGGRLDMHDQFLVLAQCRQQRDGYNRALPLCPARPRPDMTPSSFSDKLLKWLVKVRLVCLCTIDMRVAEDNPPRRHAFGIAMGRNVCRRHAFSPSWNSSMNARIT